jgi:hypothetical protein
VFEVVRRAQDSDEVKIRRMRPDAG